MRKLFLCFMFIASLTQTAFSFELTGDQLAAFSPLFAGYTGGAFCDKEVDADAAARYLVGRLGNDTKFSVKQVAEITFMVIGQQSMQASLGALPRTESERKKYCQSIMRAFGPTGNQIPGILKP